MYCDSCGAKLSYPVKYCRRCGQKINGELSDTQPLPVINPFMLQPVRREQRNLAERILAKLPRKSVTKRPLMWRILYDVFLWALLVGYLYVLASFQTIKEYQSLTGAWGALLLMYLWWKR